MNDTLSIIKSPTMLQSIQQRLPNNIRADRYHRIIAEQFTRNPGLLKCDPQSIYNIIYEISALGLDISPTVNHGFLIPYGSQLKFIISAKGLIYLALRSNPEIRNISAYAVDENDVFTVKLGLSPDIVHEQSPEPANKIKAAYAVCHFKTGVPVFEVINKDDLMKIRSCSKNPSLFDTWASEFARKSAVKRLSKYLNLSVDVDNYIAMDNEVNFKPMQEAEKIIDTPSKTEQLVRQLGDFDCSIYAVGGSV